MDFIYSNFSNVKNSIPGSDNPEMLKLSNYLSQQHGHKTIFYGDKNSLEIFNHIPFNERYELTDPRILKMPKELWSICKFFAIIERNAPFLHIDHDMLLFKNIDEKFLKKNILYFHKEPFLDEKTHNYQKAFKLQLEKGARYKNKSYNCAILGGQNYKILKQICNEIIDYIIENLEKINSTIHSKKISKFENFMAPVLVEQVWIFKLLQHYKQKFTPLLKGDTLQVIDHIGFENNICHLQSGKKSLVIKETINKMNKHFGI